MIIIIAYIVNEQLPYQFPVSSMKKLTRLKIVCSFFLFLFAHFLCTQNTVWSRRYALKLICTVHAKFPGCFLLVKQIRVRDIAVVSLLTQ